MTNNLGVVKMAQCPHCGYVMDCASSPVNPDYKPKPGDFSMCLACGGIMRFTEDLGLKSATDADLEELSPGNRALFKKMQALQKEIVTPDKLAKSTLQ